MLMRSGFLLLCLALGALTTVALAWSCAAWINPELSGPGRFTHSQLAQDRWEMISTRGRFGHTRIDRILGSVPVRQNADGSPRVDWPIDTATFDEEGTYSRSECGWPWRALACIDNAEISVQPPGEKTPTSVEFTKASLTWGLRLSPWTSGPWPKWRALPFHPLWIGLVLDVLFLAALWAVVLFGADRFRRLLRVRKGLCPQCRYDLRAAPKRCPECGWKRPGV